MEIDPFDTASYFFTSADESSVGGVPGLIAYCVYRHSRRATRTASNPSISAAIGWAP